MFLEKALVDDRTLEEQCVCDGASLTLVLQVQSALTNLVVSASPAPRPESADMYTAFDLPEWMSPEQMQVLDVTNMDDMERDDLLQVVGALSVAKGTSGVLLPTQPLLIADINAPPDH